MCGDECGNLSTSGHSVLSCTEIIDMVSVLESQTCRVFNSPLLGGEVLPPLKNLCPRPPLDKVKEDIVPTLN